jgi:hypothetical protein
VTKSARTSTVTLDCVLSDDRTDLGTDDDHHTFLVIDLRSSQMATVTRERAQREAAPPAKAADNTLDEQHAGIPEREFPVDDNDQSPNSGQAHVADAGMGDRECRIAEAAYFRAERRGFVPGKELDDWLEAEKEEDSR